VSDSSRERLECKIGEVRVNVNRVKIFEYGSLVKGALKVVLTKVWLPE
jgi:hypothetical protein